MSKPKNTVNTVEAVLKKLLKKVGLVDFRSLINEDSNGDLVVRNKHYQVISIDNLITIARENDWGLCKDNGFIYVYNGEFWNCVDENVFKNFLALAAYKMGVDRIDARYYVFQEQLLKQFHASAFLSKLEYTKETVLINLRNGTYEITPSGGRLREFDKKDFLTYQLPFRFDPSAGAPLFHKYLDRVLPDKNLQDVLCEYLGYVFIRSLKLEKCLLLYGNGANGKSVFFEVANSLLGKENVSNFSLGNLAEEHNRALIVNKLLNYGSEIKGNIESDIFKQLVSGEPIQCRMKYGQSFFIEDYARLCFNCNELPRDVEHSEAYFRRFLIIPFNTTIPEDERDPDLARKIIDQELSGVFNWVLEGVNRLLVQKSFTNADAIKSTISDYKKQSDSVCMFLDESGFMKSNDSFTLLKNIYPEYRRVCQADGYTPVNKHNFRKRIERLGHVVERRNQGIAIWVKRA